MCDGKGKILSARFFYTEVMLVPLATPDFSNPYPSHMHSLRVVFHCSMFSVEEFVKKKGSQAKQEQLLSRFTANSGARPDETPSSQSHAARSSSVLSSLFDNILSDYLWAKAVLLTTTTVATAGLTIQVPLAAIVDTLVGNKPSFTDYVGAAAVMVGFSGINIPAEMFCRSKETCIELEPGTSFTDPPQIVLDTIDSSETLVP